MGTMNTVIIIGRLGRDPEARVTGAGTAVSNFTLATDHFRADGDAQQKVTEWHRVVAFGKTAETCARFLRKGRLVCVEGSLQTRSWDKPSGEKQYTTEVIARRVTFLDKGADASSPDVAVAEAGPDF